MFGCLICICIEVVRSHSCVSHFQREVEEDKRCMEEEKRSLEEARRGMEEERDKAFTSLQARAEELTAARVRAHCSP